MSSSILLNNQSIRAAYQKQSNANFKKLQLSQFQRRAVVFEIFTLILKRKVSFKRDKIVLLPYKQNINARHV
jgi:hypothetical protein